MSRYPDKTTAQIARPEFGHRPVHRRFQRMR